MYSSKALIQKEIYVCLYGVTIIFAENANKLKEAL